MSPLLWLIYIEFEARFGKPQRAKDLVFRAVRECPWCKGNLTLRSANCRSNDDGIWDATRII